MTQKQTYLFGRTWQSWVAFLVVCVSVDEYIAWQMHLKGNSFGYMAVCVVVAIVFSFFVPNNFTFSELKKWKTKK